MKESELKAFLDGDIDASRLDEAAARDAEGEFEPDLDVVVTLGRDELVLLCDGHIDGELSLPALQSIATRVLGSDHFAWDEGSDDGELVAEILWSWSSPEDDEALVTDAVAAHRRTLKRERSEGRRAPDRA